MSDIHLYTAQTPNGIKISITLEELGLPYKFTKIELLKGTQKEPWFLDINPNGRIPALTDTFKDGSSIRLFESGSIQQYLVEEYDTEYKISYPRGTREYYETNNWLFFLNANVGPMQGQAHHFIRYAPEPIPYGINRYQNEARRLYGTLDEHLKKTGSEYLVGNKCTIADIAHFGWIAISSWANVEIDQFSALKSWLERMEARPAVKKGRDIPEPNKTMEDPEKSRLFAEKVKEWMQASRD